MKKTLSLVLSLMMILTTLTALPFTAHAYKGQYKYIQDSTLGGNTFYYNLNETEATITDFEALSAGVTDKNITIPSIINGKTVVQIGEEVFQENDNIESVTIPATVKTINNYAFNLCFGLSSVTFAGGSELITIGEAAFGSTAISSITLPSKLQYIATNAFEYCENLTSITIPNSVKTIFSGAFANCTKLSTVTIGSKVSDIKSGAFAGCPALSSISVNSANETYSSASGVLYNKNKTTLLLYPQGKSNTGFELRDETATIADYAFEGNTALQQLLINSSSSLVSIGVGAFRGCSSLKSIMDIPDSLTSIGDEAFKGVANNLYVKSACDHPLVASKIIQGVSTRKWDMDHSGKGNYTVKENVVPATCTEDGTYDEVVRCSGCDTEFSRTARTEEAKGHIPGEPVREIGTPATYDKVGYYNEYVYCTVCSAELSRLEDIEIPKLKKTSLAKATVSGIKNKTYTGKALTQSVTVKLGSKTLKKGTDYKITYTNNKSVGKATLKITGINAYSGTISKTFKINPKGTTLSKVTAGSKSFTATWKKQATQTTGYQIQYSTSSKFKNAKTVTVKKNKTTKTTVKKLKAKKKYYVRIRTYKTVSGTKYYSAWSATKTVTTKK
ncbi:MAG: leucine-rich repeat domain-containing protein [Eubacterium sp.]|nr:leucine-rich repeat domain-containing protein [Eubacterium sp.]